MQNKPDLQKAFQYYLAASRARHEGSHGHDRYKAGEAYEQRKCYFHGKGTLKNPHKVRKLIEKVYKIYPDSENIKGFWNTHRIWIY